MKRLTLIALVVLIPVQAWAWGATGHRLIGRIGVQALPAQIPAFVRSAQAVDAIGEIAREPDRSKGTARPHDADLDPGHFVDLDDQGRVLGGPSLTALPATRDALRDRAPRPLGRPRARPAGCPSTSWTAISNW